MYLKSRFFCNKRKFKRLNMALIIRYGQKRNTLYCIDTLLIYTLTQTILMLSILQDPSLLVACCGHSCIQMVLIMHKKGLLGTPNKNGSVQYSQNDSKSSKIYYPNFVPACDLIAFLPKESRKMQIIKSAIYSLYSFKKQCYN